jgi:predicted secreted hydrolase
MNDERAPARPSGGRSPRRCWVIAATLLLLPAITAAQGYGGLGTAAGDFAAVTPPADLSFPADHAPHPEFRIEWWYLTANLDGEDGAEYGAQWTLFRISIAPEPAGERWGSNQTWMAHAAITAADRHLYAQTYARGGIGQAGVELTPFRAWIDDWVMAGTDAPGDALSEMTVTANGAGFAYDLHAAAAAPPVPQGEAGYSLKAPEGQASYYYSQPFYAVDGTLTIDGQEIPVSGQAWLDREWSSQPMSGQQSGWDWFALHFDTGEKLMAYRFRRADGSASLAGTWITPDGTPEPLTGEEIAVTPLREQEVAGRELPVEWRVEVPGHGLEVDTAPLNAQSWMGTTFAYWEGPVRFSGTHSGRGYLEMTGYE